MQHMAAYLDESYRIMVWVVCCVTIAVVAGVVRLGRFDSRHRWLWRCIHIRR
jgi:hypothetical protein